MGDTAGSAEVNADDILDRLRSIADQLDGPPVIVDELARAAFETRDLDAQLALLTSDSSQDDHALVRSLTPEPRILSFETSPATDAPDDSAVVIIDLHLVHTGESLQVSGLVLGAVGEVALDTAAGRLSATLDDGGGFVVSGVPVGPLRLWTRRADGSAVTSEWFAA